MKFLSDFGFNQFGLIYKIFKNIILNKKVNDLKIKKKKTLASCKLI